MNNFILGRFDCLLSTTIVESGLDIPRANTIMINNADHFGLAQLYQLRGRVGRSTKQAFAYMLVQPNKILSGIAHERLKVLQEMNDLGSGYKIASRDLELRGAGNLLGKEQSGHVASVGMELYTSMIESAVAKLKQVNKKVTSNIKVDINLPISIPDNYIASTSQRLNLYKQIASIQTEEQLFDLQQLTEDRFGPLPKDMLDIFKSASIKHLANQLPLSSLSFKYGILKVTIQKPEDINQDKFIKWLQQPNCNLRYEPENTIKIINIPPDIVEVKNALKKLAKIFTA